MGRFARSLVRQLAGPATAAALLLVPGFFAYAAKINLSPGSGSFAAGSSFTVTVNLDSEGQSVNGAEGQITFDTSKLSVSSVSKDGSAFTLWPVEPKYSNTAGTIDFTGGAIGGFAGTRPILKVTFLAKAEGSAAVGIPKSSVVANDGRGTTLPVTATPGAYTITAKATPAPAPTTPAPTSGTSRPGGGRPPAAPAIASETHPEPDQWYATTTVHASWDIPYGVTAVKTGFDAKEDGEPTKTNEPPIGETEFIAPGDGVFYVHVAIEGRGGWSETAHRKVQIDITPPEAFELFAEGGDLSAVLRFATNDAHSGLAKYEIRVDGIESGEVTPEQLSEGSYTLENLTPGNHLIEVLAVDKAGNVRTVESPVVVTGTLESDTPVVEAPSPFGAVYWVSLLFVIIIGGLLAMLYFDRKRHREERERIKIEATEASDKLVNIFEVLRDEIEEKVLSLAHKPNITDGERAILEGLKDALDISEELLDKEIEDVRKLVK